MVGVLSEVMKTSVPPVCLLLFGGLVWVLGPGGASFPGLCADLLFVQRSPRFCSPWPAAPLPAAWLG